VQVAVHFCVKRSQIKDGSIMLRERERERGRELYRKYRISRYELQTVYKDEHMKHHKR